MYGATNATNATISQFVSSFATEAERHGVDGTVFHPSYTHSSLYAPNVGAMSFLSKFGWTPDDVANVFFASVGRVVVRDIDLFAIDTKVLGRWLDSGFLAPSIIPFRDSMAPSGTERQSEAKKAR